MDRSQKFSFICVAALLAIGVATSQLRADPPTLLQQLSDETQRVYLQSRHSMVRVQLPTPQWLEQYNERTAFLQKWGPKLDLCGARKITRGAGTLTRGSGSSVHYSTFYTNAGRSNPARSNHATGCGPCVVCRWVTGRRRWARRLLPIFVDRKYIGHTPAARRDGRRAPHHGEICRIRCEDEFDGTAAGRSFGNPRAARDIADPMMVC